MGANGRQWAPMGKHGDSPQLALAKRAARKTRRVETLLRRRVRRVRVRARVHTARHTPRRGQHRTGAVMDCRLRGASVLEAAPASRCATNVYDGSAASLTLVARNVHSWQSVCSHATYARRPHRTTTTSASSADLDTSTRSNVAARGGQHDVYAHAAARSRVSSHLLLAQARARR